jgi:histone-lysine N-methyltransferase SETMAR
VCEYAGEPLTTAQARSRLAGYDAAGAGHALLVARAVLPSGGAALRLNLDATRRGNVARCACARAAGWRAQGGIGHGMWPHEGLDTRAPPRFINHSCDGGNLELVFVTAKGELLPRVALFAARDIAAGEELTFSYGGGGAQPAAQGGAAPSPAGKERAPCCCGADVCTGWLPSEDV